MHPLQEEQAAVRQSAAELFLVLKVKSALISNYSGTNFASVKD